MSEKTNNSISNDASNAAKGIKDGAKGVKTAAKVAKNLAAQNYVGAALEAVKNPKFLMGVIAFFLAIIIMTVSLLTSLVAGVTEWLFKEDSYSLISNYNTVAYKVNQQSFKNAYKYTSDQILNQIIALSNGDANIKFDDTNDKTGLSEGKNEIFASAKSLKNLISKGNRQTYSDDYIKSQGYGIYLDCEAGNQRFFPLTEARDNGYAVEINRDNADFSTWTNRFIIIDTNNKATSTNVLKTNNNVVDYMSSKNKAMYVIEYNNGKFYNDSNSISMLNSAYKQWYDACYRASETNKYFKNFLNTISSDIISVIFLGEYIDTKLTEETWNKIVNNNAFWDKFEEIMKTKAKNEAISDANSGELGNFLLYEYFERLILGYYNRSSLGDISDVDKYYGNNAITEKISALIDGSINTYEANLKKSDTIFQKYKNEYSEKISKLKSYLQSSTLTGGTDNEVEINDCFVEFMGKEDVYKNLFTYNVSVAQECCSSSPCSYEIKHKDDESITVQDISKVTKFTINVDFCDYDKFNNMIIDDVINLECFKGLRDTYGNNLKHNLISLFNSSTIPVQSKNYYLGSKYSAALTTKEWNSKISNDGCVKVASNDFIKVTKPKSTTSYNFTHNFDSAVSENINAVINTQDKNKVCSVRIFAKNMSTELANNISYSASLGIVQGGKAQNISANITKGSADCILSFVLPSGYNTKTDSVKSIKIDINGNNQKFNGAEFYISPISSNATLMPCGFEIVNAFKLSGTAATTALKGAGYNASNLFIQYKIKLHNILFNILSAEDTKLDFFVDVDNIATDENGELMISDGYNLVVGEDTDATDGFVVFGNQDDNAKGLASKYYFVSVKPSTVVYLPFACETATNQLSKYSSKNDSKYSNNWNRFWGAAGDILLDVITLNPKARFFNSITYQKYVSQCDMQDYCNSNNSNKIHNKIHKINGISEIDKDGNSIKFSRENFFDTNDAKKIQIYNANKDNVGISYYTFRDAMFGYSIAGVQTSQYINGENVILNYSHYKNHSGASYLLNPDYSASKTYHEYVSSYKSTHTDETMSSDIIFNGTDNAIILGHAMSSQCLTKDTTTTGKAYNESDKSTYPTIAVSVGYLDSYGSMASGTGEETTLDALELSDVFDLSQTDDTIYTDTSSGYAFPLVGSYETKDVVCSLVSGKVVEYKNGSSNKDKYIIIQNPEKNAGGTYTRYKIVGLEFESGIRHNSQINSGDVLGTVLATNDFSASSYEFNPEKNKATRANESFNITSNATSIKINPDEVFEDSNGLYAKAVSMFNGVVREVGSDYIVVYNDIDELYYRYSGLSKITVKENTAVSTGVIVGHVSYTNSGNNSLNVSVYSDGNSTINAATEIKDGKINIINNTGSSLYFVKSDIVDNVNRLTFRNSDSTTFYTFTNATKLASHAEYYNAKNDAKFFQSKQSIAVASSNNATPTLIVSGSEVNANTCIYYCLLDYYPNLDEVASNSRRIILEYQIGHGGEFSDADGANLILNPRTHLTINGVTTQETNTLTLKARISTSSNNPINNELEWIVKVDGVEIEEGEENVIFWEYLDSSHKSIDITTLKNKDKTGFLTGNITVSVKFKNNVGRSTSCSIFVPSVLQTFALKYDNPSTQEVLSATPEETETWYLHMDKILSNDYSEIIDAKNKKFSFKTIMLSNTSGVNNAENAPTVSNATFSMAENPYFTIVDKNKGIIQWKGKYFESGALPELKVNYSDTQTNTQKTITVKLHPINPVTEFTTNSSKVISDKPIVINAFGTQKERTIKIFSGYTNKNNFITFKGKADFCPTFVKGGLNSFVEVSEIKKDDVATSGCFTVDNNENILVSEGADAGNYTVTLSLCGNAAKYSSLSVDKCKVVLYFKLSHGVASAALETTMGNGKKAINFGVAKSNNFVRPTGVSDAICGYDIYISRGDIERSFTLKSYDAKGKEITSPQADEFVINRMADKNNTKTLADSSSEPANKYFSSITPAETSKSDVENNVAQFKINIDQNNAKGEKTLTPQIEYYRIDIDDEVCCYFRIILVPSIFPENYWKFDLALSEEVDLALPNEGISAESNIITGNSAEIEININDVKKNKEYFEENGLRITSLIKDGFHSSKYNSAQDGDKSGDCMHGFKVTDKNKFIVFSLPHDSQVKNSRDDLCCKSNLYFSPALMKDVLSKKSSTFTLANSTTFDVSNKSAEWYSSDISFKFSIKVNFIVDIQTFGPQIPIQ